MTVNLLRQDHSWALSVTSLLLVASMACAPKTAAPQKPEAPPAAVSTAKVDRGTLTESLSYAGNIQSDSTVNVRPRATGSMDRLFVTVGSIVKAGDRIAELDQAQLNAKVQESDGALQVAKAKLDLVLAGARPEDVDAARAQLTAEETKLEQYLTGGRTPDIGTAEAGLAAAQAKLRQVVDGGNDAEVADATAAVQSAQASLDSSREKLRQLLAGGAPADQAAADGAVQAAQGALNEAIAKRNALRNPAADELDSARRAVQNAESALATARQKQAELLGGGTMSDQVNAQSGVDTAATSLAQARENQRVLVSGGTLSDRAAALAAVNTSAAAYRAARSRYDQARIGPDTNRTFVAQQAALDAQTNVINAQQRAQSCAGNSGPVGSGCATAPAQLSIAQAQLTAAQAVLLQATEPVSPSGMTALHSQVQAAAATYMSAQAVVIQLDNPSPDALQTAQTAVDTAQASLEGAQAKQAQLRNPAPADVAKAQTDVETAENNLRAARTRLDLLVAGGAPEDQAAADAAIEAAQGKLAEAQAKRQGLAVPAPADVAAARAAVDSDTAKLASAQQDLMSVAGAKAAANLQVAVSDVEKAQNTLATTRVPQREEEIRQQREKVAQARANLQLKQQPYLPQDIAQARAAVDQAQGGLDLAREQANEALVYAPIDGTVSTQQLDEGGLASPSTTIVTLVGNAVETWINLEEADLRIAHVGSPATLTTTAYPGETFNAQITVLSPAADPASRTFRTKLVPDNREGHRLQDGMFAQVAIQGQQRPDAVRIPVGAIVRRAGRSFAFVVVDGKAQRRELQLGITDGGYREVIQGLSAGEDLVISGQASLNEGDRVSVVPAASQS